MRTTIRAFFLLAIAILPVGMARGEQTNHQAKLKREEQRRWELTEGHWDLPIRQIDPSAVE